MNLNRPSLKLGQSRSRLRLSLPRQSSLAVTQRQNSIDTNTSGGSGLGAGRSSPVTDTDSFKKSETSFTKRNIKSQVWCMNRISVEESVLKVSNLKSFNQ